MGAAGVIVLRTKMVSQYMNTIEGSAAIGVGFLLFTISSYLLYQDYKLLSCGRRRNQAIWVFLSYAICLTLLWFYQYAGEAKTFLVYGALIGIFAVGVMFENILEND